MKPYLYRFSLFLSLLIPTSFQAIANPQGGVVSAGSATISQPNANTVLVNQQSNQAIINWQSFSIANGQLTQFIQPSQLSVLLNRVTGGDPSAILGSMQANGRIFLLNPNGIFFGAGSQVNATAILASTLSMSNTDFLNKYYHLTQDPSKSLSAVIHQGNITADSVAFVAPLVQNGGLILANQGSVGLGATTEAVISFDSGNLIQFLNTNPTATSGPIVIPAAAMNDILIKVVSTNNILAAGSLTQNADESYTMGGASGLAINAGTISADSGSVYVNAAQATVLMPSSLISADGPGGSVHVFSNLENGKTFFEPDALISANQGSVEVSGSQLFFNGHVTAQSLLLDPTSLTVVSSSLPGTQDANLPGVSSSALDVGANTISVSALQAQNAAITLSATGNITINASFTTSQALTITSTGGGTVMFNAPVTAKSVTVNDSAGTVNFSPGVTVTTTGSGSSVNISAASVGGDSASTFPSGSIAINGAPVSYTQITQAEDEEESLIQTSQSSVLTAELANAEIASATTGSLSASTSIVEVTGSSTVQITENSLLGSSANLQLPILNTSANIQNSGAILVVPDSSISSTGSSPLNISGSASDLSVTFGSPSQTTVSQPSTNLIEISTPISSSTPLNSSSTTQVPGSTQGAPQQVAISPTESSQNLSTSVQPQANVEVGSSSGGNNTSTQISTPSMTTEAQVNAPSPTMQVEINAPGNTAQVEINTPSTTSAPTQSLSTSSSTIAAGQISTDEQPQANVEIGSSSGNNSTSAQIGAQLPPTQEIGPTAGSNTSTPANPAEQATTGINMQPPSAPETSANLETNTTIGSQSQGNAQVNASVGENNPSAQLNVQLPSAQESAVEAEITVGSSTSTTTNLTESLSASSGVAASGQMSTGIQAQTSTELNGLAAGNSASAQINAESPAAPETSATLETNTNTDSNSTESLSTSSGITSQTSISPQAQANVGVGTSTEVDVHLPAAQAEVNTSGATPNPTEQANAQVNASVGGNSTSTQLGMQSTSTQQNATTEVGIFLGSGTSTVTNSTEQLSGIASTNSQTQTNLQVGSSNASIQTEAPTMGLTPNGTLVPLVQESYGNQSLTAPLGFTLGGTLNYNGTIVRVLEPSESNSGILAGVTIGPNNTITTADGTTGTYLTGPNATIATYLPTSNGTNVQVSVGSSNQNNLGTGEIDASFVQKSNGTITGGTYLTSAQTSGTFQVNGSGIMTAATFQGTGGVTGNLNLTASGTISGGTFQGSHGTTGTFQVVPNTHGFIDITLVTQNHTTVNLAEKDPLSYSGTFNAGNGVQGTLQVSAQPGTGITGTVFGGNGQAGILTPGPSGRASYQLPDGTHGVIDIGNTVTNLKNDLSAPKSDSTGILNFGGLIPVLSGHGILPQNEVAGAPTTMTGTGQAFSAPTTTQTSTKSFYKILGENNSVVGKYQTKSDGTVTGGTYHTAYGLSGTFQANSGGAFTVVTYQTKHGIMGLLHMKPNGAILGGTIQVNGGLTGNFQMGFSGVNKIMFNATNISGTLQVPGNSILPLKGMFQQSNGVTGTFLMAQSGKILKGAVVSPTGRKGILLPGMIPGSATYQLSDGTTGTIYIGDAKGLAGLPSHFDQSPKLFPLQILVH